MTTDELQNEAAHERLAAIRRTLVASGIVATCLQGEEAATVAYLAEQYRLCRERLDQIEREAAEEEAEHIARAKAFVDSLRDAVAPLKVGQA